MFRRCAWGCLAALVLATVGWGQDHSEEKPILVLNAGGHTADIMGLAFSPDGKELISASKDHTVRFWNVQTGELGRLLRLPIYVGDDAGKLALAPDGRLLALSMANSRKEYGIALVALPEDGTLRHLTGHSDAVWCLAFSPDGKRLASGSRDKTARIWDVASGRCEQTLTGHDGPVTALAFAPDGKRLATCSSDGTGRIWVVESGKEEALRREEGNTTYLCGIAWSPDGETLATGNLGNAVRIWKPDGTVIDRHRALPTARSLHFTKDSKALLVAGMSGGMLFDLERKKIRASCPVRGEFTWTCALSPDERVAASGGQSGEELFLWSTADGTVLHRLAGKGRSPLGVAWDPDGAMIAWGTTAGEERTLFQPGYLHRRHPLERSFDLTKLEFGPEPSGDDWRRGRPTSGTLSVEVAVGKDGRTSGRVNVKDGDEVISTLDAPWSQTCTFLSGERVAVGGNGLKLYRARTGELIRTFNGNARYSLAPSPDDRYLLGPGADQTLRIWKLDQNVPLLALFFAGDEWIAGTAEGYYAASPGGEKLMGWQVNRVAERLPSFYPAAQFRKSLYRPDVIKRVLQTGSVAKALALADEARGKESDRTDVTRVLPPRVRLTAPAKSGLHLNSPEVEVRAAAESVGGHPVTSLRLLLDGRPYQGQAGLKKVAEPRAGEVQESWSVRLEPGRHTLSVQADSAVSSALSDPVEVFAPGEAAEKGEAVSDLYVLAVGINAYHGPLALHSAAPDAEAIARAFADHSRGLYRKVETKLLTDEKASRKAVLAGLGWLRKQMTQRDVAVVFFAGHGLQDSEGSLYLLPADADPDDLLATAVPYDQFKKAFAALPGRVLLLLDACHAGAAGGDKRRAAQSVTDDLVRELATDDYGVVVMCAAMSREFSRESKRLGHGFFTQAVVEALSGKGPKSSEGAVYLHHLDGYVTDRVKELTGGLQHPVSAKPTSVRSFPLSKP